MLVYTFVMKYNSPMRRGKFLRARGDVGNNILTGNVCKWHKYPSPIPVGTQFYKSVRSIWRLETPYWRFNISWHVLLHLNIFLQYGHRKIHSRFWAMFQLTFSRPPCKVNKNIMVVYLQDVWLTLLYREKNVTVSLIG